MNKQDRTFVLNAIKMDSLEDVDTESFNLYSFSFTKGHFHISRSDGVGEAIQISTNEIDDLIDALQKFKEVNNL